jgi:hypothetical protein
MCVIYQNQLDSIKSNMNALKLVFTYLTHTMVFESETGELQGFLSQDHTQIYQFDTN